MEIQPVEPVRVHIKCGHTTLFGNLIALSNTEMKVTSKEYVDKNSPVTFFAKFFRGEATITHIQFSNCLFTYTLDIHLIHYQPGIMVNTKL